LFDYFKKWDDSEDGRKPRDIESLLARMGRWEAAWSLARVHVDQVAKCGPTDHRRAWRVTMPPTDRRDEGGPQPPRVSWRSGGCSSRSRGSAYWPQASPASPAREDSREILAEIARTPARPPASTLTPLRHGKGGDGRHLQLEDGSLPPPISTMTWR